MKSGKSSPISQYPATPKLLRLLIIFPITSFFFHVSFGQVTNISGIVNTYHQVSEIIVAKACVRVSNPAGLNYNDKVMLIQMKGASINASNSSSFGDTISLNDAGNYEIATVCHVSGDSVFMVYSLLNEYTIAGKVQLVRIPQYYSATVTDTLKPASWDNTMGTGGVLAIIVEEDLTLNAPVYADSSGFRGGSYRLSGPDCSNFFPADAYTYNAEVTAAATQYGAFKGEGVADVAAAQTGGRGAPANGGGGGNNHNNGGAGGANLSAGGDGGGNSSSAGCRTSLPGGRGKALSNYGGTKIFAGGGGGAGHVNNGSANAYGGGNGGGIVFIWAKSLVGNNSKITANGQKGGSAVGDGASGGGAGGTVIMAIDSYLGGVTIESNGGQGGSVNNQGTTDRCYGSGGGGSGGTIYFSGATPAVPVTVNGGSGGAETSRSATCNAAIPSVAGSVGWINPNYTYSGSSVLANGYCSLLLPAELIWFKARFTGSHVELIWKIAQSETAHQFIIERSGDGNNWIQINNTLALDGMPVYQDIDPWPQPTTNFYRLKMIDKNNVINYSAVQTVFITRRNEQIKVYPNPTQKKVFVTGNLNAVNEISLFHLSGKLLFRKKVNANQQSLEIALPDLSVGVYVIKIGDTIKRLIIH
jgi:hypothetical protein